MSFKQRKGQKTTRGKLSQAQAGQLTGQSSSCDAAKSAIRRFLGSAPVCGSRTAGLRLSRGSQRSGTTRSSRCTEPGSAGRPRTSSRRRRWRSSRSLLAAGTSGSGFPSARRRSTRSSEPPSSSASTGRARAPIWRPHRSSNCAVSWSGLWCRDQGLEHLLGCGMSFRCAKEKENAPNFYLKFLRMYFKT